MDPKSRNEQRRAEADVAQPLHTPVSTPAVSAPKPDAPKPAAPAWQATAVELKAAGYNAAVVARKLIDQHGVAPAEAETFVGHLFGKPVSAFAGDTTSDVVTGLVFCVVGVVGAGLVVSVLHADWFVLALPLSVLGFGARRVFFALVNRNVPPGEE